MAGATVRIHCVSWKTTLLESVPLGVTTWTFPVVAPAGTPVLIAEDETALKAVATPLKLTLVVPVRPFPRILTLAPTLPAVGRVFTNAPRPTSRRKTVPSFFVPPTPGVTYELSSVAFTQPATESSPAAPPYIYNTL